MIYLNLDKHCVGVPSGANIEIETLEGSMIPRGEWDRLSFIVHLSFIFYTTYDKDKGIVGIMSILWNRLFLFCV